MVENADLLLAAYDGQPGGTEMTIRYAKQMGILYRSVCRKRRYFYSLVGIHISYIAVKEKKDSITNKTAEPHSLDESAASKLLSY